MPVEVFGAAPEDNPFGAFLNLAKGLGGQRPIHAGFVARYATGFKPIKAQGTSPHLSSGAPPTAARFTSGCPSTRPLPRMEEMFSPPGNNDVLGRSAICMWPFGVLHRQIAGMENYPPANASLRGGGVLK